MATSSFTPAHAELLHELQSDADRTCSALASVMELLRGCAPDHPLSAGGLESLLEPIWSSVDTLCGDLRAVSRHFPIV